MVELRDVIAYLCRRYPNANELSNARVTKMIYLADWRSAITHGSQITGIEWQFHQFGPYVNDVINEAKRNASFIVTDTTNWFGEPKQVIAVAAGSSYSYPSLSKEEQAILDFVVDKTHSKTWGEFIRLVYSTYPVITQPKGSRLDLLELAQEYKGVRQLF